MKEPVLNEEILLAYTDASEACGPSRVCRYKLVNFAVATSKGSPLRYIFQLLLCRDSLEVLWPDSFTKVNLWVRSEVLCNVFF